jgi:hypothetical protein
MKKKNLPRIPVISLLSLLLLVALIVFCARSRHHGDILGFYTPAGNLQALANDRQGILLFLSDVPFGREMGLSADSKSSSSDEFREIHEWLFDPANEKWHFLGFRLAKGTVATWTWKFNAVIVPYWALLIPLAILPMQMFRRLFVRVRRSRRGQCLVCGYDLRHSPERCPECGEPVRTKGKTTIAKSNEPAAKSLRMPVTRFLALSFATALIGSVLALFWRGHQARTFGIWQAEEAAGMHRRIPEFYARGNLADAIAALRKQTGTQIQVDWTQVNVEEFKVDVHLYDIAVGTVLRSMVTQVTGSKPPGNNPAGLEICPVGGKIIVGDVSALPHYLQIHSVGRIPMPSVAPTLRGIFSGPPQSPTAEMHAALEGFLRSLDSSLTNNGTDDQEWAWADVVAMWHTPNGHAAVRKILAAVDNASSSNEPAEPVTPHTNLNQSVAELDLRDMTLTDAIETLRRQTGTNIAVDWHELWGANIHSLSPVSLHVWNTTVGRALALIFQSLNSTARPAFVVHDGIVEVMAAENELDTPLRVYDIGALVADIRDFTFTHSTTVPKPTPVGSRMFTGGTVVSQDDIIECIANFIEDFVIRNSWRDNGGAIGSMREFGGRLYIRQTLENHRKIANSLAILRSGGGKEGSALAFNPSIDADVPATAVARSCEAVPDATQPPIDHAYLDHSIEEAKFDSTIEQAIDSLREMTHANIVVYWDDFAAAGIKRDTPVKLRLWETTVGRSLGALISLVGGDGWITCTARDGVIAVGSISRSEEPVGSATRLYDVRDVIDGAIEYSKSHPPLDENWVPATTKPAYTGVPAEEAVESLVKIIEDTVVTETWKDEGGSIGSIREFAGRLLITQTPEAHRRVVDLLRAIRAGGGKEGIELGKLPTTQPVRAGQTGSGQ